MQYRVATWFWVNFKVRVRFIVWSRVGGNYLEAIVTGASVVQPYVTHTFENIIQEYKELLNIAQIIPKCKAASKAKRTAIRLHILTYYTLPNC